MSSTENTAVSGDQTATATSPSAAAPTTVAGRAAQSVSTSEPARGGQTGSAAGTAASVGAAAGKGGSPAATGQAGMTAAAAGSSGADAAGSAAGASGAAAGSGATAEPTLPPIMDPSMRGPFEFAYVETADGLTTHSLFVPNETGTQGKYPVVVWQCGNGASVSFYMTFLEHLGSHGFFVVANKMSSSDRTAEAASQSGAVDWVVAENERAGSEYMGKLDVAHIAVMGHSLGSLTSFEVAASNEHVATSIHFSGGLTGNPVGFDMKWLASMTKPTAFLCGADDTAAGPSCQMDFDQAPPALPVFYGSLANADHIGPFLGTANGGDYGTAAVAWLRWQLAGDNTFKPWFSGTGCELCSTPWTAMQRNLD